MSELPTNVSESTRRRNPHLYPRVHQEPKEFAKERSENCIVCRQPTRTWLNPHTPLCERCARTITTPISPSPITALIDTTPRKTTDEAKLNQTERAYLAHLRMLGVPLLRIQAITLKLADDTRYTADFTFQDENGRLVFADTKGKHVWEDAIIKMRVAARQFTEYRFLIVKRCRGGHGVGWEVTEVKP